MPNYKICRFCPEKYVPIADEKICPKCKAEVLNAIKSETFGEPIVAGTITDANAEAMREAVDKARDEIIEAVAPVIETVAEVLVPVVEAISETIVEASEPESAPIPEVVPEPQIEKDKAVIEEAIVELDKGKAAEIIKEEIVAPSTPKPEDKPDAPN